MSYWIPGYEQRYNEYVPQNVVHALGYEYEAFSVPEARLHPGIYPPTVWNDQISDSLLVIPRLQNYADEINQFYNMVIVQDEDKKP